MTAVSGTAVPSRRLRAMSWRIALAFFALGVVTRVPFQTDNLWAHDSVLYERAISHFDPLDQSPQAPGYLYYVLVIRALDAMTGDANRAMTIVSLVAGAAAVALLYLCAARLYDERTARISALFLLTAVTFWAYGGVAYPYTLLAALSVLCALLFWRAATTRRWRALLLASAIWAIAIGFRSDLAIFLTPLWLIAAWGTSLLAALAGAGVVALLVAVWYVATGLADGGMARFAQALAEQGQFVDDRYSVFGANGIRAVVANGYELARFLGRGLYFLAPLLAAVPLSAAARRIELADRRRTLFVLAWTLAPLVIYIPIHVGEYGYIFSMLPGLAVIAGRGAIALARGARMPRALPAVVAAVVLANASIFLLSDTPLSATDVIRKDRGITEKAAYLARPEMRDSTIYAAYDYLLAQRYVLETQPGHGFYWYDPVATAFKELHTEQRQTIVIWDDLIRVTGPGWQEVVMPHGAKLRVARVTNGALLRIRGLEIELLPL